MKSNHLNIELIMCKKKKKKGKTFIFTHILLQVILLFQANILCWLETVSWEFVGPIICTSSKAVRRVSDLVYSTANQGNTVHFSGLGAP